MENNADTQPRMLYFVGAGGIGMANLVRYYLAQGATVAGYDLTATDLTHALEAEGAILTYTDDPDTIPAPMRDPAQCLVVYTPAVPATNRILSFFRDKGHRVIKRAELLGDITRQSKGICVAGSHGKTTVSSMVAHIMHTSGPGCNAFLGGILRNYDSNLILDPGTQWSVVEADEYDRSFHWLRPQTAVITSVDPDHLDIYGDEAHYLEAFAHFTSLIRPGGTLIIKKGLPLVPKVGDDVKVLTYSTTDPTADVRGENIRYQDGRLLFDYVSPTLRLDGVEVGVPVEINVENAVAAMAAALTAGADPERMRSAMASFMGAKRRFELWLRTPEHVLIDDYAHSPNEIRASIRSVRKLMPGRTLTVIFQPHLYSRTRDFAAEMGSALSEADRVVVCEIYPARELPIPGVDSGLVLSHVTAPEKLEVHRKDLLNYIKNTNFDILMTMGAADINVMLPDIKKILQEK